MAEFINLLFYALLIATVLSLLISYIVWQRRPAAGAAAFSLMMIATSIWTGAYAVQLTSDSFQAKMLWLRVGNIGVILVPVLWFSFAKRYSNIRFFTSKFISVIVAITALVYLVLVWTNDLHQQYWHETRLVTVEGFDLLFAGYGPGFWGNLVFSYALFLIGSLAIGWAFLQTTKTYWSQAVVVIASILINWVVLFVDVFMLFPSTRYYSLAPIGMTLSGLGLSWALYYFRLFDLAPVARSILLDSMRDGMVILDTQRRIIEVNQAAVEFLGLRQSELIGYSADRVLGFSDSSEILKGPQASGNFEANLTRLGNHIQVEIQTTAIYTSRGDFAGTLLLLRNISQQKSMMDECRAAQLELEKLDIRFAEVIESIPAPVFGFSKEQALLFGNQEFRQFAGLVGEEKSDVNLDHVLGGAKTSLLYLEILKTLEMGLDQVVDLWWDERHFEFQITAKEWGVLVVGKDTTNERRLASKMMSYSDRIEGFRQIDQAILSAKTPNAIASVALEHIIEIVPSDYGSVMLYKGEDSEAVILASWSRLNIDHLSGKKIFISFDYMSLDLRRGKYLLVEDAQNTTEPLPQFLVEIFPERIGSILCVPLMAQGEFVGTLSLGTENPGAYFQEHIIIAQEISNSLAIGVQNARLFSETISSLAGEARLNQVARIISSSLDINQILIEVTRHTVELCGADAGALGLISEDGAYLSTPYLYNFPPDVHPSPIRRGEGIAWKIIESRQAVTLRQYADHPLAVKDWIDVGVRGFLGVPIAAGEHVLGALGLFFLNPEKIFSTRDVSIAKSIGRQAGVAIQNARYFELANQRAREAETLRKSGALVASSLNIYETIQHIFGELNKVIKYDRGSVYHYEGDRLVGIGFSGNWGSSLPEDMLSIDEHGAYAKIIQSKEPLTIGDAGDSEWQLRQTSGSWLGVPLINRQKLTGILWLESEQKNAFEEHHTRIARAFADHVAIALENAQLFQAVQKLSLLDPDTGSFSNKFFSDLANREFERAKRYNRPLSMVFLRISWIFNSTTSPGFDDEKDAWRAISSLIHEELRKVDDFARYDETSFIILLPESSQADSVGVIERLKLRITHFFSISAGNILEPVLEIGSVECGEGCGSIQSLYSSLFASVQRVNFQTPEE